MKESKFEVGDFVRGKKNNGYVFTNGNMYRGEIVEVINNHIVVKILEHLDDGYIGKQYHVENNTDYFELVRGEIKKKLNIEITMRENNVLGYDLDIVGNMNYEELTKHLALIAGQAIDIYKADNFSDLEESIKSDMTISFEDKEDAFLKLGIRDD